jgi:hypothetical protein
MADPYHPVNGLVDGLDGLESGRKGRAADDDDRKVELAGGLEFG